MTLDEIIEYMLSSVPEEYDISVGSFFYDLLYPAVRRCDQGVCGGLADSSWAVDSSGDGSRADVMI